MIYKSNTYINRNLLLLPNTITLHLCILTYCENLKTKMKRNRSTIKNDQWARKRQRWQAKDSMEEIVRVANKNEVYPVPFQFNASSLETNLDREQFRSKHFILATNICFVCSVLIFIILLCVWIYLETVYDCHGMGS